MRRLAALVVVALVATSCGVIPGFGRPAWCGSRPSGGPAVLPPDTPQPISTPDLDHLMCIGVENRSDVDVSLVEADSISVIRACSGMAASEAVPADPWSFEIRAADGGDAPRATFASAQLTGEAPYLIEVQVDADLNVTIQQRDSLPDDVARSYC